MAKKILIVDDEIRLADLISQYLTLEGYQPIVADNGKKALEIACREEPDLIILDIMMPEMNGYEFLASYRKDHNTPILFLTAKVEDEEKVIGLELGADDYVTKPFKPRELMARVRALLRRASPIQRENGVIERGKIRLDPAKHQVFVGTSEIRVTPSEFSLLAAMMLQPGRVFTRLDLLDIIQGVRYEGYERTIDTHIKNLRSKIERDAAIPELIMTLYGVGYKFTGD